MVLSGLGENKAEGQEKSRKEEEYKQGWRLNKDLKEVTVWFWVIRKKATLGKENSIWKSRETGLCLVCLCLIFLLTLHIVSSRGLSHQQVC